MIRGLPLLLLLAALATPALAQESARSAPLQVTLSPGDLLKVEIWREEDLSGQFQVGPDGVVVLPLLGERRVAGVPFERLRDTLLAEYREELRNPSITLTPLRRVYVLGEVNEPGLHAVDPTVSLAGAVALAGGATGEGDLRRLRVIREGRVVVEGVRAEAALAEIDVRSGDQIFVDRRGWFDRNSTFLVSALLSVTSIVVSLMR